MTGRYDDVPTPYPDIDIDPVLTDAIDRLTWRRTFHTPGDALTSLHVLTSIAVHIPSRLPALVADARDEGYTWDQIGEQLGVSGATARRRYQPPRRHWPDVEEDADDEDENHQDGQEVAR